MTMQRRRFLHLAAGAAAVTLAARTASAQAYPSRPVTLIVPFPPGGSTDVAARIVADHMSRTLGQQLVIQNVSGAGGTTGSTRAMRARPISSMRRTRAGKPKPFGWSCRNSGRMPSSIRWPWRIAG